MFLTGSGLAVNLIVTVACCVGFCYLSNAISVATTGKNLKVSTWIIWIVIPFLIQLLLIRFLFHPITYFIIFGAIAVMMVITIVKSKDLRVLEKKEDGSSNAKAEYLKIPTERWKSWLFLSISAIQSAFFAESVLANIRPGGPWALDHGRNVLKNILVWDILPFVLLAAAGGIIVAIVESKNIETEEETTDQTGSVSVS